MSDNFHDNKSHRIMISSCSAAIAALMPVALFQCGALDHLPDPPVSFFAPDRITSTSLAVCAKGAEMETASGWRHGRCQHYEAIYRVQERMFVVHANSSRHRGHGQGRIQVSQSTDKQFMS